MSKLIARRPQHTLCPLLVLLGLCSSPAALAQGETVEALLDRLAREPTIEQVQRAALRSAALESGATRSLIRRVRAAGVLPRLEASLDRGLSRDEDLDRSYQDMDELSLATDQDLDFRVRLTWDLDRLVYDPEELRARREVASLAQRRRELLLSVTRLYFELLQLRALEELSSEGEPPEARTERSLRIAELRSVLDGLTGGLLSSSSGGATGHHRRRTAAPSAGRSP